MKKAYVITLSNGLFYDDQEILPVAVCLSLESANQYIKDNTPISESLFKNTFRHAYGLKQSEFDVVEVYLIEGLTL